MKFKTIFIIATGLLLFSACTGNKKSNQQKINRLDKAGKKTGLWIDTFKNGQKKSEVSYQYGLKSGVETDYLPNGNPYLVCEYKADSFSSVLDGPYVQYYDNGNPMLRMSYIDGVPDGPITQFFRSGLKDFEGKYDHGKRIGIWKYYT